MCKVDRIVFPFCAEKKEFQFYIAEVLKCFYQWEIYLYSYSKSFYKADLKWFGVFGVGSFKKFF